MKTTAAKEIFLILLTGLPQIALAIYWPTLPENVPTHFDMSGQANGLIPRDKSVRWETNFTL